MLKRAFLLVLFLLGLSQGAVANTTAWTGNDILLYVINGTVNASTRFYAFNTSTHTMSSVSFLNDRAGSVGQIGQLICPVPNSNLTGVASEDLSSDYEVQVHYGNGSVFNQSYGTVMNSRHWFGTCAAEQTGQKRIVFHINYATAVQDNISIWNGTGFTLKSAGVDPNLTATGSNSQFVSRPGTDEIAWYGSTSPSNRLFVAMWNSTDANFSSLTYLSNNGEGHQGGATGAAPTNNITMDCSFESASGRLACFFGNTSDATGNLYVFLRNSTENGGGSTTQAISLAGANISLIHMVEVASNPVTDEILVLVASIPNATAFIWNGSTLTNARTFETTFVSSAIVDSFKRFDVAYRYPTTNATETEALFCWGNSTDDGTGLCHTWNGTHYSSRISMTDVTVGSTADTGTYSISTNINGRASGNNYWASIVTTDADSDTNFLLFNSSTFTNLTELETALLGGAANRFPRGNAWNPWDTTIPVYKDAAKNATSINNGTSIYLNASVRDNFQIDHAWLQTNETGVFVNYTAMAGRFWNYGVKNGAWKNANFTWTNNSITTNTTIAWSICMNDTNGNNRCTAVQTFQINTSAAGGGPDPCAYPGSGNWNIALSDNCVLSSSAAVYPNNVTLTGTGSFTIASGGNLDANKIFYTPASLTGTNIFAVLLGGRFSYRP